MKQTSHHPHTLRSFSQRATLQLSIRSLIVGLVVGLPAVLAATSVLAQSGSQSGSKSESQYSRIRAIEGQATLVAADSEARAEVEANHPVLTGDRLSVEPAGRVDVLLSDGTQLSLDGDTEVLLRAIARSPDTDADADASQINLVQGQIVVAVGDYWDAPGLPVVDTQNARIYFQDRGVYVIEAAAREWTRVIVRQGFAEVVDQQGSSVVRAGEEIEVEGDDLARSRVRVAGAFTALEQWSVDQETAMARASDSQLSEPLQETAQLVEHGDWVDVDSGRAWRPRVATEWRPYWNGRWATTRGGQYWVSYDSWSPVTYHYGSWDHHDRFGWLWYPGYTFAPGHVFWYWGPSYVGWVPAGYYGRYYDRYYPGYGFRDGVFGFAGGGFDLYSYWNFCPISYFGYRRPHRYYQYGHELRNRGRLESGILTTDTRGLDRDHIRDPRRTREVLERRWRDSHPGGQMPDVTEIVRRGELTAPIQREVLARDGRPGTTLSSVDPILPRGGDRPRVPGEVRGVSGSPTRLSDRPAVVRGVGGADRDPAVSPRSSSPAAPEARREAPARRVLDGIRGRDPAPRVPTTVRAPAPRPEPRSTPPATVRAPAPRPEPRSTPPATVRAPAPRPEPRSTPPAAVRAPAPRSEPRSTPPATVRAPAPRSEPRSTPPAAVRAPAPRYEPRSTPPATVRAPAPRSEPRSTPPPAVRAPAPRSEPRSTRPAAVRAPAPRSEPRSTRPAAVRAPAPQAPRRSPPPDEDGGRA